MKIKEIYLSEAGLLSRMMPAAAQQYLANRRTRSNTTALSDAAWKQWTNRVSQISRALGVKRPNDIPENQYQQYLQDFVGSTFLRGDFDRYDANTQNRINAEIDKIAQARGNAGQVRSLFQNLGTQALAAREAGRGQALNVDTRGMDPETAKMTRAFAAAQQAAGRSLTAAQAQPAQAQPAQAQPAQAQPAQARSPTSWIDVGQGLYLKPATATTPTMASYRKNIFSLTDQGQWQDARDKPVSQTWQAFLNQALENL